MRLLEPEFKKREFNCKLVTKNNSAFLYQVSDGKKQRGFEVWKKKISKPATTIMDGVEINFEESERFPSNNDFGSWAWSYITLPFAMKRFESIKMVENQNE